MSDQNESFIGVRFRSDSEPDVVFCAPENQKELTDRGYDVGDVIEATGRYLVDREGFSTKSFEITECKDEHIGLVCKVRFINDGIVMAKMHGILK